MNIFLTFPRKPRIQTLEKQESYQKNNIIFIYNINLSLYLCKKIRLIYLILSKKQTQLLNYLQYKLITKDNYTKRLIGFYLKNKLL